MRYQFLQEHRHLFPLCVMCRVLNVSRSGYHAWTKRLQSPPSQRDLANQQLTEQIRQVHQSSRSTYGSPRVHIQLQRQGTCCSRKRVERLMKKEGLVARKRRCFTATTDSKHHLPVAQNLLGRQFAASEIVRSNQVWAGDITFIPTAEGWLYLAAVLDLHSRRVVGWQMAASLETPLVVGALAMAIGQRHPQPGLLHHSDRGSQYASGAYQSLLAQSQMVCSMSRRGNCWDNAPVESFFSTLKSELTHLQRYRTQAEARASIFEYIEVFYNRQRLHSTLGYLSPVEYERQHAQEQQCMAA